MVPLRLSNNFSPSYFFLKSKIPRYEYWASTSRAWVLETKNSRCSDKVSALEEGSKAALNSVHRRIDQTNSTMEDVNAKISQLEDGQKSILQLLQQLTGAAANNPRPAIAPVPPAQQQRRREEPGEFFFSFCHFCCHFY